MRKILFIVFFIWLFGSFQKVNATIYYVDFDGGNDSNNGTSSTTAWLNLPGTRNAGNTAFLNKHSIAAGDTIYIKSGTTHNSSDGGRVLIDSTYYANGTSGNPITIQRKTDWGLGQIIIDGTGITVSSDDGLFEIQRDYIVIDGVVNNGIKLQKSSQNGFMIIDTGINGSILRNLEAANSTKANVLVESSNYKSGGYISNVTLENITAHDSAGGDDWYANIMLQFLDQGLVKNCTAYGAGTGSDGIHLGSCKNTWVEGCTTYSNGEQGVDISRDGDYKNNDNSYNNTIRNCVSYNNLKMNFDSNSASRDIYFINDVGWRTTESEDGDANFHAYEAANRVFFINCTSAATHDMGYAFSWWSSYYNLAAGSYNSYVINSISSSDTGMSCNVESDYSSRSFNISFYNSDFNSVSGSTAVQIKGTNYTKTNINNGTGGWPGTNCKAVDPLYVALGSTWATTDLRLQASSPCIDAGVFPFTTASSGSGTVVSLSKLVADLDARMVFRAGDTIQIEGAGQFAVSSVNSATQITLTSSASWQSGQGVWFPWPHQKLDMGALPIIQDYAKSPPSPPSALTIIE